MLAAEYRTTLPAEHAIAAELEHTRELIEERRGLAPKGRTRAATKSSRGTKRKGRSLRREPAARRESETVSGAFERRVGEERIRRLAA